MLTILFFGRLSDVAGRRTETLDLPENVSNVSGLKTWLNEEFELDNVLEDQSIKIMVNQAVVHTDLTLNGDEEIGFLPPVGGG